jgi:hypothetical protein
MGFPVWLLVRILYRFGEQLRTQIEIIAGGIIFLRFGLFNGRERKRDAKEIFVFGT